MAPDTGLGLLASDEVESTEHEKVTRVMLEEVLRAGFTEEVMEETTSTPPTCPAHLAEPEPRSYAEACNAHFAGVWKAAMASEFRGLLDAGTFAFENEVDASNVIDGKWVSK